MSQFNFPRVNFYGKVRINAATANNNSLFPLVLFDPVSVTALLPPRIYISENLSRMHKTGLLPTPESGALMKDEEGKEYLEISVIRNEIDFKSWSVTPLGSSSLDECYHRLYSIIKTQRGNQPLTGLIPANWNYYGGMDISFEDVTVHSIENLEEGKPNLYTIDSKDNSDEIQEILAAKLELKNSAGRNVAVMVDVIPTLGLYTQIFCDNILLKKNERVLLSGCPTKASLRFLNAHRITNRENALASSGSFYSVIPFSDDEAENKSFLATFFSKEAGADSFVGFFIRYNLFEVEENLHPDYGSNPLLQNPGFCSILGSITPWVEGDLKSITIARQMNACQPFSGNISLAPFLIATNENRKLVFLDLTGSVPEEVHEINNTLQYRTKNLGNWVLKIQCEENKVHELGIISEVSLNRDQFIAAGGMYTLNYGDNPELHPLLIENGSFNLYQRIRWSDKNEQEKLLMQESRFMLASDQAGIYIDQGEDPEDGYLSYKSREPCVLSIYERGRPCKKSVDLQIRAFSITSPASGNLIPFSSGKFTNGQHLFFPSHEAANVIYILSDSKQVIQYPTVIEEILATGFFINLRVLPSGDYGKYLDPLHPEFPTVIAFETLYREVLLVYDLIYPLSSSITPFTYDNFRRSWNFIKKRFDKDNWSSYSYMPSSRDLSSDRLKLLEKWFESLQTEDLLNGQKTGMILPLEK